MVPLEKVIYTEIKYGTAEYEQLVALRTKNLREPLGMQFTEEQLKAEVNDYHIAAFLENKLIAGLILTPADKQKIKMRQVAVDQQFQNKGVGKELVKFSELFSRNKGFTTIYCHARDAAADFYLQLNYKIIGEPFTEVGIKHFKMEKQL